MSKPGCKSYAISIRPAPVVRGLSCVVGGNREVVGVGGAVKVYPVRVHRDPAGEIVPATAKKTGEHARTGAADLGNENVVGTSVSGAVVIDSHRTAARAWNRRRIAGAPDECVARSVDRDGDSIIGPAPAEVGRIGEHNRINHQLAAVIVGAQRERNFILAA